MAITYACVLRCAFRRVHVAPCVWAPVSLPCCAVWMYACMCVNMDYAWLCVHVYACARMCVCVYMCVCVCARACVYMCVCSGVIFSCHSELGGGAWGVYNCHLVVTGQGC